MLKKNHDDILKNNLIFIRKFINITHNILCQYFQKQVPYQNKICINHIKQVDYNNILYKSNKKNKFQKVKFQKVKFQKPNIIPLNLKCMHHKVQFNAMIF